MEDKTGQGWVKIHRKLKEKGYYNKSAYVHLWVHLLLSVNHKPKEFMWNGNIIIIKEGQIITGRNELSKQTGIPPSTIEDILKMLETQQQIQQQKTTKYRLITILNWEKYQQADKKTNNKPTTSRQQADTNKNEKNEKNEKKRETASKKYLQNIPQKDLEHFTNKYVITEQEVKTIADKMFTWCEAKGKSYKNYKMAMENWISKDYKLKEVDKYAKYN